MQKRDIHMSKQSLLYRKEEQEKEISRMYPECKDIRKKYKLFLTFSLWQGIYESDDVEAVVEIAAGNKLLLLPRYKLRHLYPNRNYYTVCMKNGKRLCDDGIILLFDSFEELAEIKSILCRWKMRENGIIHCIQVLYDISAEKKEGKTFYTLESREVCNAGYLYSKRAEKSIFRGLEKINEYDLVFRVVNRWEKESLEIRYLSGEEPEDEETIGEEAFLTFFNNVSQQEFMEGKKTNQEQTVDSYYSKIVLVPDIAAVMI